MLAATVALAAVAHLASPDVFALPFVASACVVAMVPQAPLARPVALLLGYGASTVIAAAATAFVRPSMWTAVVAAVASTVAMLLLKAPHPPAAVAAALIGLHGDGPGHLLQAVGPAVAIILAVAVLAGRGLPAYRYPLSWR
jgi:CBS-domain-containing membrane protein